MIKNDFKFCPMCASKNIKCEKNHKWFCPDCGFDLYNNVAAAVGVIICDKYDNILFEIRAKNPQKGFLALPGGFIDPDESAEQAAIRECTEEIGVKIDNVKYVCTNPNTYPYKNIEYKTCDIFFTADLPSEFDTIDNFIKSLKAQKSEVQGFKSCCVKSKDDVGKLPLAFESAIQTLKNWIDKKEVKND